MTVGGRINTQFTNNAQCITAEDVFVERSDFDRSHFRRTKIVCTLGPACWGVDSLVRMMDAGMDVCRFNFSHGDHASHAACLARVKEAMKQRPQKRLGLLLDTKGPEIRTGLVSGDAKTLAVRQGEILNIVPNPSHLCDPAADPKFLGCSYTELHTSVKPGNIILVADGSLSLRVEQVVVPTENEAPDAAKASDMPQCYVSCRVLNDAKIGERKNMNLPGVKVGLPVVGEKEVRDLLEFAIPNGMHYIAASFVQCAQDVRDVRSALGEAGRHIKVISKIENQEGLTNVEEILEESDGIMIARGDMGMEIPFEKVFVAQKMIIAKCNLAGKPVIVATQMLESMMNAPRPTRAEVSDVANAVLDGCDCVMLSGESAGGRFPTQAVEVLARICLEAESCVDYPSLYRAIHTSVTARSPLSVTEAVCCSAVESAEDVNASLIVALTESGFTARMIAKYRPPQIILALSASDVTVSQMAYVRGVIAVKVDSVQGTDGVIQRALCAAQQLGFAKPKDTVVCVHGILEEVPGHTNLMKIVQL